MPYRLASAWLTAALSVTGGPAAAHVSEQGFVLLLPTDAFVAAGVAAVALTVLSVAFIPPHVVRCLFRPMGKTRLPWLPSPVATSLSSLLVLGALLVIGLAGSRDPLANPLPLFIWTLWWMEFLVVQAIAGDLWHWLNPWTGLYHLSRPAARNSPRLILPPSIGILPAIVGFAFFAGFYLIDPAPEDPARLAKIVALYWFITFIGMQIFGPAWLERGECFTVVFRQFARLSPFKSRSVSVDPDETHGRGMLETGLPGWRVANGAPLSTGTAILVLMVLATGSFDGLNETFWWLARIGVNPLEFPGRSAVMLSNGTGLLAANIALVAVFAFCVRLGLFLIGEKHRFGEAFGLLAPTILPIALTYHFAHFLTAYLVNVQYALAAFSDPLGMGADLIGLGRFYVTTGFLNSRDSVLVLWLAQAGAVVLGHMLAILLAHALAVRMFGDARKAIIAQGPLIVLMIAYTLFGLWLLATPRGA